MKTIYWALLVLAVFVAIWFLFVVPAERRHHERKLAALQKKIEKRQGDGDSSDAQETPEEDSREPS